MPKPSTTHVIEIESGIGEPAFIPLTVGQELQPISLGRKAMWTVESAGVLEVHAFMYFDGTALFLQSADESTPASVDGFRVGKSWTELHAPCRIDIGTARLRFRCLADEAAERAERAEAERREAERREIERREAERIEAQRLEAARLDAHRRDAERREAERIEAQRREMDRREAERMEAQRRDMDRRMRAQTGPPPPEPLSFPKNDRSFSSDAYPPGVGPTRQDPYGRRVAMTGPPAPRSSGRRYPSAYPGDAPNRTADMALDPMLAHGSPAMPHYAPPMHPHEQHYAHGPGPGMHPIHPGVAPMGPGSGVYQPYPTGPVLPSSSAPYNSVPPGYGSMTGGQVGGTPPTTLGSYLGRYKDLSTPKRVLVVLAPFCLAAAAYLVLFDTPAGGANAAIDAGAEPAFANGSGAPAQPVQLPPIQAPPPPVQVALPPAQVPQPQPQPPPQAQPQPPPQAQPQPPPQAAVAVCPPGFVPYPMAVTPGAAIPCVPAGTPMPGAQPVAAAPTAPPSAAPQPPADPSAAAAAAAAASAFAMRTLERQAVDFVAVNDYAHAAAVYELLQQQNPSNRVYAEAARILRAKADAGAP